MKLEVFGDKRYSKNKDDKWGDRTLYMDSDAFERSKDDLMNKYHRHDMLGLYNGTIRHNYYARNGRRMLIIYEIVDKKEE